RRIGPHRPRVHSFRALRQFGSPNDPEHVSSVTPRRAPVTEPAAARGCNEMTVCRLFRFIQPVTPVVLYRHVAPGSIGRSAPRRSNPAYAIDTRTPRGITRRASD